MQVNLRDRRLTPSDFLSIDIHGVHELDLHGNTLGGALGLSRRVKLVEDDGGGAAAETVVEGERAPGTQTARVWLDHPGLATVRSLVVSKCGLTSIDGIAQLARTLTKLRLGGNGLSELPPSIGQLSHLTLLSVSDNGLTRLPVELAKLRQLRVLSVTNNRIKVVPKELARCTHLRELYLRGNRLRALPNELRRLKQLESLDISVNGFDEVPIVTVTYPKLTTLAVESNPLMQQSKFRRWLAAEVSLLQLQIFKSMQWSRKQHGMMRVASQGFHISLCVCLACGRKAALGGKVPHLPPEIWEAVFQFLSGRAFTRVPPRAYRNRNGSVLWS
eukprot:m.219088 g.219088  ORF g.219088 m.219088 type:complete len:331 (+) comp25741_c0_seq1:272-1264(+)